MSPLTAQFSITAADLREADARARRQAVRRPENLATLMGLILMLSAGVLMTLTAGIVWLVVSLTFASQMNRARQRWLPRIEDDEQALQDRLPEPNDIRITADECGIDVVEPHARTHYDWSAFSTATETDNLFLLSDPATTSVAIPKRAFTPADAHAFRTLLRNARR